jgi:ribosomal protein S12 methylthiotransferase RimO
VQQRSVAVVTLGCTRNEVDSEELAGRLEAAGWTLVDDAGAADVALVNTCGFIEQAKKDSIDTLLEAADLRADAGSRTRAVVAVGCMAERYGSDLAEQLPEADAVLGFDSYADLSSHLEAVLAGSRPASHAPRDRRSLLPLTPVARQAGSVGVALPGHGSHGSHGAHGTSGARPATPTDLPAGVAPASGPPVVRRRLGNAPWAPLKLASGCDRRCSFCAIPSFRGAFVSRRPDDVVAEAHWLADRGVREVFLVSENTTSYGKDLGDLRSLEALLPRLGAVPGLERVRVSYLQPAEMRPGLIEAIASTPTVVPYFDLSFQHASPAVLRRMRRFGGTRDFLALLEQVRAVAPEAGIRSNVIVGFPGETEDDVAELEEFLTHARLDVVGVFGYSDEDGTEAATLDGHVDPDEVADRTARLTGLVEELTAQRAEDRIGQVVHVLVEDADGDPDDAAAGPLDGGPLAGGEVVVGRAEHQGPDVDGITRVLGAAAAPGDFVRALVVASEGVDLVAEALR